MFSRQQKVNPKEETLKQSPLGQLLMKANATVQQTLAAIKRKPKTQWTSAEKMTFRQLETISELLPAVQETLLCFVDSSTMSTKNIAKVFKNIAIMINAFHGNHYFESVEFRIFLAIEAELAITLKKSLGKVLTLTVEKLPALQNCLFMNIEQHIIPKVYSEIGKIREIQDVMINDAVKKEISLAIKLALQQAINHFSCGAANPEDVVDIKELTHRLHHCIMHHLLEKPISGVVVHPSVYQFGLTFLEFVRANVGNLQGIAPFFHPEIVNFTLPSFVPFIGGNSITQYDDLCYLFRKTDSKMVIHLLQNMDAPREEWPKHPLICYSNAEGVWQYHKETLSFKRYFTVEEYAKYATYSDFNAELIHRGGQGIIGAWAIDIKDPHYTHLLIKRIIIIVCVPYLRRLGFPVEFLDHFKKQFSECLESYISQLQSLSANCREMPYLSEEAQQQSLQTCYSMRDCLHKGKDYFILTVLFQLDRNTHLVSPEYLNMVHPLLCQSLKDILYPEIDAYQIALENAIEMLKMPFIIVAPNTYHHYLTALKLLQARGSYLRKSTTFFPSETMELTVPTAIPMLGGDQLIQYEGLTYILKLKGCKTVEYDLHAVSEPQEEWPKHPLICYRNDEGLWQYDSATSGFKGIMGTSAIELTDPEYRDLIIKNIILLCCLPHLKTLGFPTEFLDAFKKQFEDNGLLSYCRQLDSLIAYYNKASHLSQEAQQQLLRTCHSMRECLDKGLDYFIVAVLFQLDRDPQNAHLLSPDYLNIVYPLICDTMKSILYPKICVYHSHLDKAIGRLETALEIKPEGTSISMASH